MFPSRDMDALLADDTLKAHHDFWRGIKAGYDRFNKDHTLFGVRVDKKGSYSFY